MTTTQQEREAAFVAWRRRTAKINPDDAVALDGFTDGYANRGTRSMHIGFKAGWDAARATLPQRDEPVAEGMAFGCHCDLDPDESPDGCVWDTSTPNDCVYAKRGVKKEDCEHWRPIQITTPPSPSLRDVQDAARWRKVISVDMGDYAIFQVDADGRPINGSVLFGIYAEAAIDAELARLERGK